MQIEKIAIAKINPARYNPRKDLKPGDVEYEKLKKSIAEFDLVEPLIMNKRGNVLVGGHQRLKILKELGHTETDVSIVDLPPEKEKALNLALNKISGEWDMPLLKDLLEELDTGEFDIEITGFDLDEIEDLMTQFYVPEKEAENIYTAKVDVPQYEIKGENPSVEALINNAKARELEEGIANAGITRAQKEFLLQAAKRHLVFDYSKIAEYYAHAGREMQELMEMSALVIIDYDNAIKNGYVKLSTTIAGITSGLGCDEE